MLVSDAGINPESPLAWIYKPSTKSGADRKLTASPVSLL
jgi:hypothetical protein